MSPHHNNKQATQELFTPIYFLTSIWWKKISVKNDLHPLTPDHCLVEDDINQERLTPVHLLTRLSSDIPTFIYLKNKWN